VDLVCYTKNNSLEYDFELAAHADPRRIRLIARGFQLDPNGALEFRTRDGEMRHRRPAAYQIIDGKRVPVTAAYVFHQGEILRSRRL
jgi:hypothetical protein